ncbi:hypothetical protein [Liquorilactobacillus uvarum]|nr:hypothetical protein [Liquorilactobacillus uvarum]
MGKKVWLGALLGAVIWLSFNCITAAADTTEYHVNYTIRQPITNKKAEVDTYFNKPAIVRIEKNHYKVIISIITNHNLGSFPFQILKINGLLPEVEKKIFGQQDYYTFSFITQDVHQKIYGEFKADIDSSNYHYQGGFNLDLDAAKIPELTKTATETAAKLESGSSVTQSDAGKNNQVTDKTAKNEAADESNQGEIKAGKNTGKKSINNAKTAATDVPSKKESDKGSKKTKSNDTGKILLVIGIVVALGVGGWGLFSNYRG